MQTYPFADRDCGHMKINEPPMPYNYCNEGSYNENECGEQIHSQQLAEKEVFYFFILPALPHPIILILLIIKRIYN